VQLQVDLKRSNILETY